MGLGRRSGPRLLEQTSTGITHRPGENLEGIGRRSWLRFRTSGYVDELVGERLQLVIHAIVSKGLFKFPADFWPSDGSNRWK